MGNQKSLLADFRPLDDAAIAKLSGKYRFSKEEIVTLHKYGWPFRSDVVDSLWDRYFTVIAGSVEDDGVIDVQEFQAALGFTNSVFATRVFAGKS